MRKVEKFISSQVNVDPQLIKGKSFESFFSSVLENLTTKSVHLREETKDGLVAEKTIDLMNRPGGYVESDDTYMDRTGNYRYSILIVGEVSRIDIEVGQTQGSRNVATKDSYCAVCAVPQPLRTVHCFHCKSCVATYDHHSPFLNTCIGEQNRKFYFLWLLLFTIQMYYAMLLTYSRLEQNDKPYPIHLVFCLIISAITEMFFVPIFGVLALHQIYIALLSHTSNDIMKCDDISGKSFSF